MKTTKRLQILTAAAIFLTTTSAWAMEQDTGYPWYRDIPKESSQITSQNKAVVSVPVLPSDQDTGYPWFADIKDNGKPTMKTTTVFKSHPRVAVDEDSGYPWYNDIKEDRSASLEPEAKVQ